MVFNCDLFFNRFNTTLQSTIDNELLDISFNHLKIIDQYYWTKFQLENRRYYWDFFSSCLQTSIIIIDDNLIGRVEKKMRIRITDPLYTGSVILAFYYFRVFPKCKLCLCVTCESINISTKITAFEHD